MVVKKMPRLTLETAKFVSSPAFIIKAAIATIGGIEHSKAPTIHSSVIFISKIFITNININGGTIIFPKITRNELFQAVFMPLKLSPRPMANNATGVTLLLNILNGAKINSGICVFLRSKAQIRARNGGNLITCFRLCVIFCDFAPAKDRINGANTASGMEVVNWS